MISEGETYYYTFNAHGDVVGLMNESNQLAKSYDYDAFGIEKNPSDEDSNPFRYCGEYYDVETGTYYLRARYYDPWIGRFTSEDSVRDGINWYAYCYDNPLTFIDPSGNVGILPDDKIYISDDDTDLDVRILKYKIAIKNATNEKSKKYLQQRLEKLINQIEDKNKRTIAKEPLEYFEIVDITESLENLMMKEEEDYKDMAKKNAITKFTTFYNIVRNGSLMDLKNQPEWHHSHFIFREEVIDYDAPGNINYGYLGKIFAIKDLVLYAGAGYAQIMAGNSNPNFITSFFDDPRDQKMIKYGIDIYNHNHNK